MDTAQLAIVDSARRGAGAGLCADGGGGNGPQASDIEFSGMCWHLSVSAGMCTNMAGG